MVVVNTLLAQLFRPLDMLGMVYRTIRQGLIDMDAMFALIDTPAEVVDAPDAAALRVEAGHVRFEDVHFAYEPGREILSGIDFEVRPGTMTAVVGPSGAGKSTLSRLLFRFYEPSAGRISIDGQDIGKVTQASLRAALGIVPQDTVLFNDTIGYNIGYGKEGATQTEIEAAARGAAIHDFVTSLPQGYEAMVGERGLKLSGGEKQRVAIARTLLKDPPILILDEATSALDSRTEAAIQETLQRRRRSGAPRSSSPTACRPWSTPTRSSSSTRAASPSAAPTPSCSAGTAFTPRCGRGSRASARLRKRKRRSEPRFPHRARSPLIRAVRGFPTTDVRAMFSAWASRCL